MSLNGSRAPEWRGSGVGRGQLVLFCVLVVLPIGCDERVVINADGADRGLVVLMPGIDGRSGYSEAACRALCSDEFALSVELRDWTSPLGLLNQMAVGRNRAVARKISAQISDYLRQYPDRPVYLIGHSGGTAMAVWAAESLPDGEKVEGIILLASSLSPGYDLSEALARSRSGIVSFYSPHDGILGAGTSLIGTMDGQLGASAGKVGFDTSPGGGYDVYRKLYQVRWDRSMASAGNGGGHFGCMAVRFVGTYVRPLVRQGQWNGDLIAAVSAGRGDTLIDAPPAEGVDPPLVATRADPADTGDSPAIDIAPDSDADDSPDSNPQGRDGNECASARWLGGDNDYWLGWHDYYRFTSPPPQADDETSDIIVVSGK